MDPVGTMWIAIVLGVIAVAAGAWTTYGAVRAWRDVQLTYDAAGALLDAHQAKLDATIHATGDRAGQLADRGEELSSVLAELSADTRHLRSMLARIPDAREALQREFIDLLLPTKARDDG
ncbi:MAG: hypothetical protein JWM25_2018 [Thermoleophilia bacterium]|nr:hypothetical protein [Thermoleophilia bacterium]